MQEERNYRDPSVEAWQANAHSKSDECMKSCSSRIEIFFFFFFFPFSFFFISNAAAHIMGARIRNVISKLGSRGHLLMSGERGELL